MARQEKSFAEKLTAPVLAVGLLAAGCGSLNATSQSLDPAKLPRCEVPTHTPSANATIGALVLKPDGRGRYAQVPSANEAAEHMTGDVIAEVVNQRVKKKAVGVAVGKWILVAPDAIIAGAKDVGDLAVVGPSRSAAVYGVCGIPEYGLAKIRFGRTVSQGNQFIELADQPAQPGAPIIAATKHGSRTSTIGGIMLEGDAILTGLDATSKDANGNNTAVDGSWSAGMVMSADGKHLQGLITARNNAAPARDALRSQDIQLVQTDTSRPTVSPILDYDVTWRVVHAEIPK